MLLHVLRMYLFLKFYPADQEILRKLEKEKILVFTPSRRVQGRRVVCYDDRFIVKLAFESDGIIVSNDNYRDLANEKPEWKKFIDERLLMYSFVNDKWVKHLLTSNIAILSYDGEKLLNIESYVKKDKA